MAIDIHALDEFDEYEDEAEEAFDRFSEALIDHFLESPEGKAHLTEFSEAGFWIRTLLDYGYRYEGYSLPDLNDEDVDRILCSILPRKVSLSSRDEAEDAIPELKAFWRYAKREYELPNADEILAVLDEIEPDFVDMMFDESRFGIARSFLALGQQAGYDMTDQDDINKFMQVYNAQALSERPSGDGGGLLPSFGVPNLFGTDGSDAPQNPARVKAKKSKRKMAKASQKKNRKNKNKKKKRK